mmetsp:Transcript_12089/g.28905  ORF Transcript_12089/g.28905 Transcript_12089/m.28905 type:complete len:176 (+) Transcript_12089:2-529(+)
MGKRLRCQDPVFSRLRRGPSMTGHGWGLINVEDPIEVSRNLNFAIGKRTASKIRAAIQQAAETLRGGDTLEQLRTLPEPLIVDSKEKQRQRIQELLRHRLPVHRAALSIIRPPEDDCRDFRCLECFRWARCSEELEDHQNDTGHSGVLERLLHAEEVATNNQETADAAPCAESLK